MVNYVFHDHDNTCSIPTKFITFNWQNIFDQSLLLVILLINNSDNLLLLDSNNTTFINTRPRKNSMRIGILFHVVKYVGVLKFYKGNKLRNWGQILPIFFEVNCYEKPYRQCDKLYTLFTGDLFLFQEGARSRKPPLCPSGSLWNGPASGKGRKWNFTRCCKSGKGVACIKASTQRPIVNQSF